MHLRGKRLSREDLFGVRLYGVRPGALGVPGRCRGGVRLRVRQVHRRRFGGRVLPVALLRSGVGGGLLLVRRNVRPVRRRLLLVLRHGGGRVSPDGVVRLGCGTG
nr:hypothetical protein [Streptomyces tsukubensis NRRL18488]